MGRETLSGWAQQAHIIDTAHYRIHQGRFFSVHVTNEAVASAGVHDVLIQTGAAAAHAVISIAAEGNTRVQIFEDTTFSAAGTVTTPVNNNRYSARIPTMQASSGPTITSPGTQLDGERLVLAGRVNTQGSEITSFLEYVLKANTNYLVRCTNLTAQNNAMSVALYYYEPTQPI